MKKIIDVQSGEVKAGGSKIILRSSALGSCIAVAAYDPKKRIGALAHIMLPGRSPDKVSCSKEKYAADAIDEMITRLDRFGVAKDGIVTCLVGGANVLQDNTDIICGPIIRSVTEILEEKGIKVVAKALGGVKRRSISFDVEEGIINYTEGNSKKRILWKTGEKTFGNYSGIPELR